MHTHLSVPFHFSSRPRKLSWTPHCSSTRPTRHLLSIHSFYYRHQCHVLYGVPPTSLFAALPFGPHERCHRCSPPALGPLENADNPHRHMGPYAHRIGNDKPLPNRNRSTHSRILDSNALQRFRQLFARFPTKRSEERLVSFFFTPEDVRPSSLRPSASKTPLAPRCPCELVGSCPIP